MVRGISATLGAGLAILFIAGLVSATGIGWLAWLDLAAALLSFAIAAMAADNYSESKVGWSSVGLGAGLIVLWLIALSSPGVPDWQSWWTFAFGLAYAAIGLSHFFEAGHAFHAHHYDRISHGM